MRRPRTCAAGDGLLRITAITPMSQITLERGSQSLIKDISVNDRMFSGDKSHYFAVGASALEALDFALLAAHRERQSVQRILDLPCGHGRVLRYLRSAFAQSTITACDLDHEAVDYCASTFNAIPCYSEVAPNNISVAGKFDLIWCGSLLTHLKQEVSRDFLELFDALLAEDGVLVFSVHGASCAYAIRRGYVDYSLDRNGIDSLLRSYDDSGYGYADYPGEKEYGISLISPIWIVSQLQHLCNLRLLSYTEMGWDHHHDVIACINEPPEKRVIRALGKATEP